ncbi:MAG: sugar phosphate isomerase/epimerase [Halanaerobiaceae bacterium]|nr:sugar phosphate isomerase/epimerase [Halanaerobiaceae bacterium]
MKIGLQLYTLREETEKDFLRVLEEAASIGYDGVEFAGFGGIGHEEMKEKLEETGLEAAGSHTAFEILEKEMDTVINYNKSISNTNIVVPYYEYSKREDYMQFARRLERIGRELSLHGMNLLYHNHSHEFEVYGGEYGLDILFSNAAPAYLKAEIDICWVYAAGVDPVRYVEKYRDRLFLLHMKDMAGGKLTEVGNGEIDMRAVVEKAREIGVEWLIVEQDDNLKPGVESARISFRNLKEMI